MSNLEPRREPILWIQLLGIGAIPLELLILRLLLAASEVGPIPSFERIITWTISILIPTIFFLKRPADWGSVILFKIPIRSRTNNQIQLSKLQVHLIPRICLIIGGLSLLFLFWWIDQSAWLINSISPFKGSSRLITLISSIPLLTLILWQWHQLTQSIWLLTRFNIPINLDLISNQEFITIQRTCIGFNLLSSRTLIQPESISNGSIKPEQTSKQSKSSNLNSKITNRNLSTAARPQPHDDEAKRSRSEQGYPEESSNPPPRSS